MKFFKIFSLFFLLCSFLYSKENININFENLSIMDLIKITAKINNKNILLSKAIKGKVNFISNNVLSKKEVLNILRYVLDEKGYSLIQSNEILRIVKKKEKTLNVENKRIENKSSLLNKRKKIKVLKNEKRFEVIFLKNIEAGNILKILQELNSKKKEFKSSFLQFSIDSSSNALIIQGNNSQIRFIKALVSKLDKDKLQVYVQAKIIEVNDKRISEVGIKYGIEGGKGNSSGIFTFASTINNGKSIAFSTEDIGLNLPNLTSGLALGASINLLKENYALDIVSEPSILCINNQECSIYVGETISVKTSNTLSTGGVSKDSFIREDIGLSLKVKPRISNKNKVMLHIEAILEGVTNRVSLSGNPDTSKKEIKTTAIVNNGESVIIAGLIENKIEITNTKVPLLGDIPFVGNLFKNKNENKAQTSLVIIITPYIIPESKDLSYVREQLAQLKLLESKYTKELELRLLKNKLKNKIRKKNFQSELKKIKEALKYKTEDNTEKKKENHFMKERRIKIDRLLGKS